jgi:pimeloyl-ACP methyl ester carboxylesterase
MAVVDFDVVGNGKILLLIHGFPMNKDVWKGYGEQLASDFKVITIDLPGFGQSPPKKIPFSIHDVAQDLIEFVEQQNFSDIAIVGHSLGGYVALSMVDQAPKYFSSLILFHSTALPDTIEKKASRNKVLEFIRNNGVLAFTSNFIPSLFANAQDPSIEKVKTLSVEATEQAVVGYTQAMRDRPDSSEILKNFGKPILFIGGDKDLGISPDSLFKQSSFTLKSEVLILKDTGHMGMFESFSQTIEKIRAFARQ